MTPRDKASKRWPTYTIRGEGEHAFVCRIRKTVSLCQNLLEQNKLSERCDCLTLGCHEYPFLGKEEVRNGRDTYGLD